MAFLRGEVLAAVLAAANATASDRARRILEDPSYQRDLPTPPPAPELDLHLPHFDSPVLELLAYAGLAVAAVLAAVWLFRRFA